MAFLRDPFPVPFHPARSARSTTGIDDFNDCSREKYHGKVHVTAGQRGVAICSRPTETMSRLTEAPCAVYTADMHARRGPPGEVHTCKRRASRVRRGSTRFLTLPLLLRCSCRVNIRALLNLPELVAGGGGGARPRPHLLLSRRWRLKRACQAAHPHWTHVHRRRGDGLGGACGRRGGGDCERGSTPRAG